MHCLDLLVSVLVFYANDLYSYLGWNETYTLPLSRLSFVFTLVLGVAAKDPSLQADRV